MTFRHSLGFHLFTRGAGHRGSFASPLFLILAALPFGLYAQTTVTLTTSRNPSTFGTAVTLTAAISPTNATGRVTFFDGVNFLGTASIGTGSASLSTALLPAGSRKLKAFYSGVTSNVVTQTVNAQPGGTYTADSSLFAAAILVADMNGDGKADLVTASGDVGTVSILLGNGSGGFQFSYSSAGYFAVPVAVADFNGDGKMDVIAVDGSNNLAILLGNGDGTLQTPVNIGTSTTVSAAVGDFNGDGKPDLAVADTTMGINVFLGNGDGTFQTAVAWATNPQTGVGSNLVVVGDFSGDGKADLAAANQTNSTVSVLVGRGDGTFQLPVTTTVTGQPGTLAVADFNGDGKSDLAASAYSASTPFFTTVSILLSRGDGTLQTGSVSVGSNPYSVVTGDFNGDGIVDLAVGNLGSQSISIILGVGNGTFQTPVTFTANPYDLQVGEFNGDGRADLATSMGILLATGVSVTATAGTPQSTPTGTQFALPLQVTVSNGGVAMSGVTVTFTVPTSGPSATLSSGTAVTNATGVASVTATANSAAGTYSVTATALGLSTSFSLTNTGGSPASITATGGTPQSATVGTAFAAALQATVKDGFGNGIAGVTVTFTPPATGAGATLSAATAVTNASGVASITATANSVTGSYSVTAAVGALSTTFALTNVAGGNTNLALGKNATQSSNLPGYTTVGAGLAVDGNTDGNFFDGSVSHTNQDANAWWQVDLGSSVTVNSIVIWNRTDCCGNRLSDYWVFVSNTPFLPTDTPATLSTRAGTFASHQTTIPSPSTTINVGGFQGEFVRVQLSGTNYLSLAEVQVLGTAGTSTNIALGKTATQSSNLPGYTTVGAALAVDGNTDGNFFDGSVSHTNQDANAWWQVDLGSAATVNSIVIWNRTDCCSNRLSDYWVFVSNTPFLATDTPATLSTRAGTFASHQTTVPSPSSTITVSGFSGRYVRVQLTGTGYLSLAEVQVFGTAGGASNVSVGKTATQSSNLPGYTTVGAALAVDGNTDGNFFDGSVSHTNLDANAWWQVDLGASTSISSIAIWNRTDCCGTRLNDFWVFVSDTPFNATDTPATLSVRAATFSSHQTTAPSPSSTVTITGAQGRYVRVQLSGTNYLSLAEVQVFGQ